MRDEAFTDDNTVTFGKYNGYKLKDVPASYLDWLSDQDWFLAYTRLHKYILANRERIDRELDESSK